MLKLKEVSNNLDATSESTELTIANAQAQNYDYILTKDDSGNLTWSKPINFLNKIIMSYVSLNNDDWISGKNI